MKKIIPILVLVCLFTANLTAQVYRTASGTINFYSKTPLEDIVAKSNNTVVLLNTQTNAVVFQVQNTSFKFQNKLMEEHFNEKYMESEKYTNSTFAGKINEVIDYTKEGEFEVTVTGKLKIHGVEQVKTINGKIIIKGKVIQLISNFNVKVADHNIEIPKLVTAKIAEEIEVTVDALLMPKN